ncbi:MAG: endo-1,4-beta-xylanase [Planctomycetes bacterium]|nr:endo-1,4-beta-xylanase [Planctomycetota bacterium]
MLAFAVYLNGEPATEVRLSSAYVVGSDDVPLRADLSFNDGIITCEKRAAGPAGLAILWQVEGCGEILTETARVLDRQKPYVLQVELARGRLLRVSQKIEEWGLFDFEGTEKILEQFVKARDWLVKALQAETPQQAAANAQRSLVLAVKSSEALTKFHADIFLSRRKETGGWSKRVFGCAIHLDKPTETVRKRLSNAFEFVTVPVGWRDVEPNEQTFNWKPLDAWVEALTKHRIPIKGSALLSFHERHVPDWLYIWEHDFDTIRDLAFEQARRVINRYSQYIQMWDVISGIHATNCFSFSFEQLMELTRMAAAIAKQSAPNCHAIIDLIAPWGEYYARNQRTIPPLLYADMVAQSGVNFDAFGLQFHFGTPADGTCVRDMFQISSVLDSFAKLGKPLHITAVQVPSDIVPVRSPANEGTEITLDGGRWHDEWSEQLQAAWLKEFVAVALSKPFIESVTWGTLADHPEQTIPHAGLLRADLVPKKAYNTLNKMRSDLMSTGRKPTGKTVL